MANTNYTLCHSLPHRLYIRTIFAIRLICLLLHSNLSINSYYCNNNSKHRLQCYHEQIRCLKKSKVYDLGCENISQ